MGGRGDAFNDAAYRGLERAKKELGVLADSVTPEAGADRDVALRQFASGPYDLIVAVGFLSTDDLNRVAKSFPSKHFAGVDYAVTPGKNSPANVTALEFREQEAAFLGGVIAALTSKSKKLGFVGGMDAPQIRKFAAGFRAGAKWADPKTEVFAVDVGTEPSAFHDPARGKALALGLIARGADVLFHASGATGAGVFEAARENRALAIGVDSDQYKEAPGFVLTSVTKQVETAVFDAIKEAQAGRLKGPVELGLKESGVDYVYDERNKNLISPVARAKAEEARALIISGRLKVPTKD